MSDQREEKKVDEGVVIQIITWFLFIAAVLIVCAGVGTKYALTRKLASEDRIMLLAQAFFLAQCLSISFAASSGLGKPAEIVGQNNVEDVMKAEYTSLPFLIVTLALIKWSITSFINSLSPVVLHQRIVLALRVVIVFWMVSATLVSIFQCEVPRPWDYIEDARCVNRRAWWTYVSTLNILTELGIVVLYVLIIGRLQTTRLRRGKILTIFLTRLLVIAATAAQLAVFWDTFPNPDITKSLRLPVICNQLVICFSVITACLPYLKPLMESLESSIVRGTIPGSEEEFSQELSSYQTTAC